MYKLVTDLDGLIKRAEKGNLIAEEFVPEGAEMITKCYGSVINAYEKFQRKEFSLEDTKKVFKHGMQEMAHWDHEFNSVLIPQLLMLYQDLCTKH